MVAVGALCSRVVFPQHHIKFDLKPENRWRRALRQKVEFLWTSLRRGDDVSVIEQGVFRDLRQARIESNSVPRQSLDALDRFSRVMARAGLAMKVVACKTDEIIYQAGDSAENIYQVVSGAVRGLRPFSEGHHDRIDAFHLPGQIFGLEYGSIHGSAAEASNDSILRVVKRSSIEQAAKLDAQVACELWSMTADRGIVLFDRTLLRPQTASSCGPASVVAFAGRRNRLSAGRAA
jgi:CRP-like cAMP-binding protein